MTLTKVGYETNVYIITTLELNVALTTASLPATTPLLKMLIPKSMRSSSSEPYNIAGGDQSDIVKVEGDKCTKEKVDVESSD
jgi:hypothetical protein